MSWSDKYKRSINCDSPKGFSQRAHCAARKKRAKGEVTKSKSPFNEMLEIKPHKSVEQIAKKHRLHISFVKHQLEMGIPIEHEHTKDKVLATDIALQHLDEIPDYYTRLIKMERDAKKHHKKFKDVKEATDGIKAKDYKGRLDKWFDDGGWVQTGGKYDGKPCAKQPGQTTKPYCRDPDDRATMDKDERNRRAAKKRKEDPNPNRSGEAKMVTQESAGEKDACYKKVKSRYNVWPSAYASGALVKCRKVGASNWGTKSEACWDGYVAKGMKKKGKKMVPNCVPVKEETGMVRYCPKCKKDETQSECKYGPEFWRAYSSPPALTTNQMKYNIAQVHPANEDYEYSMARSEISTIIGAAKRLRKKFTKGEGNIEAWVQSKITKAADYLDTAADYVDSGEMKKESVSIEDANGNHYVQFIDIIKSQPLKASKGIGSRLVGEGALPSPIDPSAHKQAQRTQKLYNKGTGTDNSNEKEIFLKRTGPQLPLAKKEDKKEVQMAHYDMKTFGDFMSEASAAWQRKEGKNPEGGLNKKGIASYRKEHPGSHLSLAVTTKPSKLKAGSKSANRRKSFCSRMKGMKAKLTSAKTAHDPDSRINKSLRKWNC